MADPKSKSAPKKDAEKKSEAAPKRDGLSRTSAPPKERKSKIKVKDNNAPRRKPREAAKEEEREIGLRGTIERVRVWDNKRSRR